MLKKLRLFLIKKLIGKDIIVISNIKITSDILKYNRFKGKEIELINVNVKEVSDNMSFVYNPSNITIVR